MLPVTAEDTTTEAVLPDLYSEQLEASGAQELWEELPQETKELLDTLGITGLEMDSLEGLRPDTMLDSLWQLLTTSATGPLRSTGILLGILLLCALIDSLRQATGGQALPDAFQVIGTLAIGGALLIPINGCIQQVCEAAESTTIFMGSYVPVYAGILLAGGQAASAAAYQTVVLFAAELMTFLATHVLVPLTTVSLALGITGALTPKMKLGAVGGFLNKTTVWVLSLTATLFVGLLSLQTLVGSAADTLGNRAIKFSLSSFVPVVGGALSEAFGTVRSCLGLLKGTLGGFGILTTALIVLPPLLTCMLWSVCLSLCGMAAEMLELRTAADVLTAVKTVVNTLVGILAACSLFMIVATTILTMAGGG